MCRYSPHSQGDLAILAALGFGDSGANTCGVFTEEDSDSILAG
jgi:hypothetical protein